MACWGLVGWIAGLALVSVGWTQTAPPEVEKKPFVVFLTGDEEYRSEESMPMLAKILAKQFGFRVAVCYSLDEEGHVAPTKLDNVTGLEALANADCMVMYLRFRQLPPAALQKIVDYANSGRPMVGFRTSTHAFRYPDGPLAKDFNERWLAEHFGQKWITHHGHFGDGQEYLTEVSRFPDAPEHPILRGFEPFQAYSWLYHVEGGGDKLHGDCQRLLLGKALKSSHAPRNELERFPITNPVAWTKPALNEGETKQGRVFFTTLGHPFDFKEPAMRRLAIQGILWALAREDQIPSDGVAVDFAEPYEPNNSGVNKHKPFQMPELLPTD